MRCVCTFHGFFSPLDTLSARNEYEIVAVFKTVVYTDSPDSFKYYHFADAEHAEESDSYIGKCKKLALYDTGVTAEGNSGDACKQNRYIVGSSSIYGYGVPKY